MLGRATSAVNENPEDALSSLILSSNIMDRTQTGHVLGNPPPIGAPVVSAREVPRSILKYKTVLGTLDATPKVP